MPGPFAAQSSCHIKLAIAHSDSDQHLLSSCSVPGCEALCQGHLLAPAQPCQVGTVVTHTCKEAQREVACHLVSNGPLGFGPSSVVFWPYLS